MKTSIFVTTQFEATHCWPDAPKAVEFLRNPHRHMFHVRLDLAVKHDDREMEFILVKRELDRVLRSWCGDQNDLGRTSCETLARELADWFNRSTMRFPHNRVRRVEVSEDGENGAIIELE